MSVAASAQTDTNIVRKEVVKDADSMMRAFARKDFIKFADYSHPGILKVMGGKANFILAVTSAMTTGELAEAKIEAGIGELLQVIKTKGGYQALIEQKMVITIKKTQVSSTSALYGVSGPDGRSWKFADVGDKEKDVLNQFLPEMDKRLLIPKKKQEVSTLEE
jgi:hypothetical protein